MTTKREHESCILLVFTFFHTSYDLLKLRQKVGSQASYCQDTVLTVHYRLPIDRIFREFHKSQAIWLARNGFHVPRIESLS